MSAATDCCQRIVATKGSCGGSEIRQHVLEAVEGFLPALLLLLWRDFGTAFPHDVVSWQLIQKARMRGVAGLAILTAFTGVGQCQCAFGAGDTHVHQPAFFFDGVGLNAVAVRHQLFVGKLVLRDMLEQRSEEEELDQVQLMTLHASKGLEFPHVYIMGMEEELMPHRNSIEADTIEEERRLMYVGITRAKRTLTLTYAGKRRQYGETTNTTHSRFLDELPTDDIVWEGRTEVSAEEQKQRGQETLNSLKNMLADF